MNRISLPKPVLGLALAFLTLFTAPVMAQSTINQFSLGTDLSPLDIAPGPDGNLWYTVNGDGSAGTSKVGRITPAGTITEFVLPDTSRPTGIVAGPDGGVWFTESGMASLDSAVGRIDPGTFPAGGSVVHFTAGIAASANPFGICVGPDGNLWFAERNNNAIAQITTAGTVMEFPIGAPSATPLGVVAGPDGNIWFSDRGTNSSIGVMDTTGTVLKRINTPTVSGNPGGIAVGPDNRIWFVEFSGNKVGVMATSATLTTDITEYATPTITPFRIVSGPDGALWFTENNGGAGGRIGRITTSGTITEYPTAGLAGPYGITLGPDRAIWFTQRDSSPPQIGQLVVDCVVTVPTITGGGTQCKGTTLTLTASGGYASYQWYQGGLPIGGATSSTYTKTATTGDTGSFTVTGTNGACTSNASDPVLVAVTAQPTAGSGGPQTICSLGTTAGLGGTAPTGGTGAWSVVGGGTGTFFPDATTPNATFTHTGGTGPITLRWTVSNPPCTDAAADVVVTVSQPPTTASAGGPQTICALGTTAGLGGNAPASGTGSWSVVSGGSGTFSPSAATPNATFTHTGGTGPVLLAWTISSAPCAPSVANVTVTITPQPTAGAGGPQTICALGTTAGLGGTTPTGGTGAWSIITGGVTGTFTPNATTANATFTHLTGAGPVTLRWTVSNGTCTPATADVIVTITPAPTASAGGSQTICALGTTTGLGGNSPTGGATGAWSVVGGGTGTFSPNATTPNATFTHATGAGPVTLRWTVSNGTCTPATADVTVTITPQPTAGAGGPQTICALGTTAGLGGTAPTGGTGAWSVVSGGTGTFSPDATTANATFTHLTGAGPVTLRWTVSNGTCTPATADVTVTITPQPTASAGSPQTICALGTTAGLGGNTPAGGATGVWSVVSGGTGTFSPSATTPDATFTHATGTGPLTLRWTVSNGTCTPATADVTVTITPQPTASVGGFQTICALGTTAPLGGNTPTGGATGAWSVVSGGTGTFSPTATTPNATFTHATGTGPVVLRWTVSNGTCTPATADVTVTITPQPTTASAGGPQTICALGTTTGLGGNSPTTGAGTWSVVSGGTGSFSPNATTPNATFTHLTGTGPVLLAWTISNGTCTPSVANVTVTITPPPTTATAGGPQTICNLGSSQPLGGNTPAAGVGTWSVVSGGTGTFAPDATTPNATFTHTGGAGPVVLAWTISNPPCAPSVANVTLTIGPNQTVAIAAPVGLCANSTATASVPDAGVGVSYTWSVTNGTIVSGQGTPNLVFSAGPSGSVTIDIVQVDSSCTSTGTVTIPIDPSCAGPLAFVPVTPCRRIDTRLAADSPAMAPGEQRTFILTAGPCSIPSTAKSVAVNVTVTEASAPGFLKIFPTGTSVPPSSTISFKANQTRANNAIIAVASDGTGGVDVKNVGAGTIHLIIDVNGYFQ